MYVLITALPWVLLEIHGMIQAQAGVVYYWVNCYFLCKVRGLLYYISISAIYTAPLHLYEKSAHILFLILQHK